MAKKITGYIKLQVPAGGANPSPPVGPALGQKGLNIMEFCKAFNARTQSMEKGAPIPVVITVYGDRTFSFEMKKSPVSYYLKKMAQIKKGASNAKEKCGTISPQNIVDIAREKMSDFNLSDVSNVQSACRMVLGSARSMGLEVEGGSEKVFQILGGKEI